MSDKERPPRAATIFDVARLAGVSHQTVSRVVNDLPNVRASTKERVQQAITQLRYSPSPAARTLVTKRSRLIGLVVTSAAQYGPASTALYANEAARAQHYSVLTITMLRPGIGEVREAIESLIRQNVEGIVLVSGDRALVTAAYDIAGIPLVTVDPVGDAAGESVAIDQYAGARLAVQHLIDLGHRSVLHLAGPADSPDAAERVRGWRDALADAGLPARGPVHADWSADAGYRFGRELDVPADGLAVFASNDTMALGVIHALHERGVAVPERVSVVGFDDLPEAAHFRPPLTTVRQDFEALAGVLMRTLFARIESGPQAEVPRLLPTLVVRDSSAPPNCER